MKSLNGAPVLLLTLIASACSAPATRASAPAGPPVEIVVHKGKLCGCCGGWIEHMEANGFVVAVRDTDDLAGVKQALGVPSLMGSCHTSAVGGYVVEGHVPASAIRRLLAERPDAKGLLLPGMPPGSPGMESARPRPYSVLVFRDGEMPTVFSRH
jgi:hypothetical protein